MDINYLHPGDEGQIAAAAPLFDNPPDPEATRRFLATPGHHLLLAVDNGRPAGFISGVEMTHPDKGTEMFVYELSVGEEFRRRGVGRELVEKLAQLASERDCYGMWVMTDEDNEAALATYRSGGASEESAHIMLGWSFRATTA